MAISNTSILVRRSLTTATPTSFKQGEIGYSYSSNNFFIGSPTGDGVVAIGGYNTYTAVNNATQSNTASTLVKRDPNGAFFGRLYGDANTADTLTNSQNFSVSGGDITASAVGFNGSAGVTLNASLNNVGGLTNGTVGSSSSVPVIQYGANGRILSVSSAGIQTSFTVSDSVNSNTVNGGSTLTFKANTNSGITTYVGPNNETVYFGVDNTLVRANTSGGPQSIGTDVQISGNLIVTGAVTYVNTSISQSTSSLLHLAANNTVGDVLDIGFVGTYNNGSANLSTGLVRDAGNKGYYLFSGVNSSSVTGNTVANNLFTTANTATLYANIIAPQANASSANITTATIGTLSLTNPLALTSGGTGATSFTNGQIVIGNGTTSLISLANSTYSNTGTYGTNSTLAGLTVDAYGRTTAAAWQPISGLTVSQGGTGQATFATGQLIIGGGTGPMNALANSSYANTGTYGTNSTLAALSVDAYGRTTAASWQPISGLTVSQGGTGAATFTTNGITYGNGTGAIQVTAAAGTSDQTWSNQIMTVNNSGVPTWTTTMDGGTF